MAKEEIQEGLTMTELLRADHAKVKGLFEEFESAGDESSKENICITTLRELIVHDMLEEEIFYPALREVVDDQEIVDKAGEEHHVMKFLITELAQMKPDHERYDARYKVMAENVKHHIEEEENELFPKIENSGLDLSELGARMQRRKEEILEQGIEPSEWAKRPGGVEGTRLVFGGRRNAGRRARSRRAVRAGGRRARATGKKAASSRR